MIAMIEGGGQDMKVRDHKNKSLAASDHEVHVIRVQGRKRTQGIDLEVEEGKGTRAALHESTSTVVPGTMVSTHL